MSYPSSVILNRDKNLSINFFFWVDGFIFELSISNTTSKSCCSSSCKVTHGRCSRSASVFFPTIKCNFLRMSSMPVPYLIHLLLQGTLDGLYLHIRPLWGTDKPRFVKLYLTNLSALLLSQFPVPFLCKYSNSHVEQLLSARTDQPRCPSQKKKKKNQPAKKPINQLPNYMVITKFPKYSHRASTN